MIRCISRKTWFDVIKKSVDIIVRYWPTYSNMVCSAWYGYIGTPYTVSNQLEWLSFYETVSYASLILYQLLLGALVPPSCTDVTTFVIVVMNQRIQVTLCIHSTPAHFKRFYFLVITFFIFQIFFLKTIFFYHVERIKAANLFLFPL